MDTTELTSEAFWNSSECCVIVNPRDDKALAEADVLRDWAARENLMSNHLLFATSGSTGAGKWVALGRPAILASAQVVNEHLHADSSDRWLLAIPSFHVGGMGILARACLASCDVVEFAGKWNASAYHSLVEKECITLSSLVPTQLVDIVRKGLRSPESLRALLIGGGRLDDEIYQRAIELGWPVMETYGMTETSSQVATAELGNRALKILPCWQASVWRDGSRLALRGDPLLSGYVTCTGGKCEFKRAMQEGWFVTGDVVELHDDVLKVKGRADRCVKVLGELVNLTEVEKAFEHKTNRRSVGSPNLVIVALPESRRGNRLVLCGEDEKNLASVVADYNKSCNPVERIDCCVVVDKIPRSALGKVRYAELAEIIAEKLGG